MIRIRHLAAPIEELGPLEELAARRLRLPAGAVQEVRLVRKAIDARRYRGTPIQFFYTLDVKIAGSEKKLLARFYRDRDVMAAPPPRPSLWERMPRWEGRDRRPVVVGFGPAGMMAALCWPERDFPHWYWSAGRI